MKNLLEKLTKFNDYLRKNKVIFDGNIGGSEYKINILSSLSSYSNVKNALEIGFNVGHSALIMLESNPNLNLICVEINGGRAKIGYEYLKKEYGERIELIIGNSLQIVPRLIQKNITYYLIFIDGNHKIILEDINNCRKLKRSKDCRLVLDDCSRSMLDDIHNKIDYIEKGCSLEIHHNIGQNDIENMSNKNSKHWEHIDFNKEKIINNKNLLYYKGFFSITRFLD